MRGPFYKTLTALTMNQKTFFWIIKSCYRKTFCQKVWIWLKESFRLFNKPKNFWGSSKKSIFTFQACPIKTGFSNQVFLQINYFHLCNSRIFFSANSLLLSAVAAFEPSQFGSLIIFQMRQQDWPINAGSPF